MYIHESDETLKLLCHTELSTFRLRTAILSLLNFCHGTYLTISIFCLLVTREMDRDDKVLSLLLNAEMDSVGFNKESVRCRVEMFKKRSKAKAAASRKLLGYNKEKVIVGSRRDGIATETSDTDVLLINHDVYCSTDAKELDKIDNKVCFLLENEDAPPGYAFLSLYSGSNGEHFKEIESSTEFKNGKIYLSNDKYMSILKEEQFTSRKGWFGRTVQIGTRKGPSIPKTVDAVGFEADLVGAFPVSFKGIISDWQAKERLHDWPNKETVQKVAKLPMYVVAVGEQGSSNENLLWRLSFNEHEMILVYSMNDSQTKVLVLMRLLAKNLLTPI
jgi:predicted nucleotidyltransferase